MITVKIEDDAEAKIREVVAGDDIDLFVHDAIRAYFHLYQARTNGNRVYIGTSDKIEYELILPPWKHELEGEA